MVRNQGMANSSGIKLMLDKCCARSGSWNALSCENLLRYSLMIAELSFRKNHCRYFGMKRNRLRNASSGKAKEKRNIKDIFQLILC